MNTNAMREKVSALATEVAFLLRKTTGAVRHLTKASPGPTLAAKLVDRLINGGNDSPGVPIAVESVRSQVAQMILAEAVEHADTNSVGSHERFAVDIDAIDEGYSKMPGALEEAKLLAPKFGLVMGVVEGSNVFFVRH